MRALSAVLLATLALGCLTASAAADRFVLFQLEGTEGDYHGEGFDGWTSAAHFSHNIPGIPNYAQLLRGKTPREIQSTYTPTTGYRGFVVTKEVDKSTPALLAACANAQRFDEMKLALCNRAGGEVTREALFTLEGVRIASMTVMGPGSGARPPGVAKEKAIVVIRLMAVVIGNNFEEVKVT